MDQDLVKSPQIRYEMGYWRLGPTPKCSIRCCVQATTAAVQQCDDLRARGTKIENDPALILGKPFDKRAEQRRVDRRRCFNAGFERCPRPADR